MSLLRPDKNNTAYALEIQGLRKIYANGVEAVKHVDLTIKTGDFFGLLGANGAGKSTTIGLISTLLTKTAGKIFINDYDLDNERSRAKACIGLVPQEINLNIFETGTQILLNQAGYYGVKRKEAKQRAQTLLQQLGLWDKRHVIVRQLSGGMKRRLMIARALIHQPQLLILDEPTAGVDIEIRRSLWAFLRRMNQQGITILLTTHYLEEAEQLCKNIAIIDKGCVIENTSTKSLLQTLTHQTFILNTFDNIMLLPNLTTTYSIEKIDSHTLEVRLSHTHSLNEVFALLSTHGIRIQSMRNKSNRLEELFLDRIQHDR